MLFDRFPPKRIALIALFTVGSSIFFLTSIDLDSNRHLTAAEEPSLKDTLEKGLRARRPVEFQFIAQVVTLVDQGQLPRKLVLGTFHYARKKGNPKYPFPYFQQALILRAAKIGVQIN